MGRRFQRITFEKAAHHLIVINGTSSALIADRGIKSEFHYLRIYHLHHQKMYLEGSVSNVANIGLCEDLRVEIA
jgi:hypothetical protein